VVEKGGTDVRLRSATGADGDFVIAMARYACVIEDWSLPDPDSEETLSLLPGDTDVVIIATDAVGTRLGAAWTFENDPPLLIGADGAVVPELAIAVVPGFRGAGIGGRLLDELVVRCSGRYDAISLNVHVRNPAAHLYERKVFEESAKAVAPLVWRCRKASTNSLTPGPPARRPAAQSAAPSRAPLARDRAARSAES
jgi:GNAT superfamily N-acetyltransferase